MNLRNFYSGLFWLALSIFVCLKSAAMGIGTFRLPGPGFLPFWSSAIFGLLAAILVIRTSVYRRAAPERAASAGTGRGKMVILVLLLLFAYLLFLQKVGYLLMTFGLMLSLLMIGGKSRWWIQILSALFTSLFTYVVFYRWLGVELPKGILEF